MVEEINGKESEEEDEDEKDMFPFHFFSLTRLLARQNVGRMVLMAKDLTL
jgi:hypothetical protein